MKRIKSFGVYQTSKVVAIIYFLVSAVFMIPFGLFSSMLGNSNDLGFPFGGMLFIALPFLYGIIGFIMTAIGCYIYNVIAKYTGGIEFDIEVSDK